MGVMIVCSIAFIPRRIAYKQDASGNVVYSEYFVDAVFWVDIVLCFNSAYFEEVANDPHAVARSTLDGSCGTTPRCIHLPLIPVATGPGFRPPGSGLRYTFRVRR